MAEEFQIDVGRVKITATTTAKVPNTSATAASSGSDMNGMAAEAAPTIKQRLIDHSPPRPIMSSATRIVGFLPNRRARRQSSRSAFADLVNEAYMARVSLSATGFYKTPKIHYDRNRERPAVLLFRLWRGGERGCCSTR